jgi:DAACS family dicarboxylate/amino acid:cation (Na+ or H+) symporter
MVLGIVAGLLAGSTLTPLGVVGKVYIQLIKVVAIPLVLFSILEAIVATDLSWRTARVWLCVIIVNTTCALVLGLALSNIFKPGVGFTGSSITLGTDVPRVSKEFSLGAFLDSIIPASIIAPFSDNNVLSVVLVALLVGAAIRHHVRSPDANVSLVSAERVLRSCNAVVGIILGWLVRLVPIAVFCVTARTVGEHGLSPFQGLARYVGVGCLGLILQIILVYPLWIVWVGKLSVREVWRVVQRPIAYAFGTNSSLATLPVTLHALDELRVPKAASRLGACIGTNFNNDGILLYEAMAVLFVAQAMNVDLSVGEQVFAALMSLAAAMGVAGVPEAGVVSLSLVLSAVGLPLEILPLLLTVDWIVARMRSVTNVMSDITVSIAVARLMK